MDLTLGAQLKARLEPQSSPREHVARLSLQQLRCDKLSKRHVRQCFRFMSRHYGLWLMPYKVQAVLLVPTGTADTTSESWETLSAGQDPLFGLASGRKNEGRRAMDLCEPVSLSLLDTVHTIAKHPDQEVCEVAGSVKHILS